MTNVYLAYHGHGDTRDLMGVFASIKEAKAACSDTNRGREIEEWKIGVGQTFHIWTWDSSGWKHMDCNVQPAGKVIEDEEDK